MEFGIFIRREETYEKMLNLALKAEEMGFMGAFLNDHVIGFANEGKQNYLEAWTAMTGIGVQTSKLRIGQIVLFNSLRNPAFLAKSIASLDQMTNGRFELMIGAGWNEQEYLGYDLMEQGRGMPSAKERVDRFEETLQILRLMLSQEVTDFDGKFWKLKGAINMPLPIQQPLRMSVGCSKPRMMRIAAKYANGINLSGRSLSTIDEAVSKFARIAEDQNKHLDDYYVSGFNSMQIAKDKAGAKKLAKPIAENAKISIDDVLKNYFVGTAENIVEKINTANELGINMFVTVPIVEKSIQEDPMDYFYDNIKKQL
ncbi:MAG: LLM class flavin-dependent oxidoreductase [Candidatus Kariarchaeaceae archaeon]